MADRATYKPAVIRYVGTMLHKLHAHRNKGHWRDEDNFWLLGRVKEEYYELADALYIYAQDPTPENAKAVQYEAADVGNIAMMIHDNVRRQRGKS